MTDIEELSLEDRQLLEGGVAGSAQGEKCLRVIGALRAENERLNKACDDYAAAYLKDMGRLRDQLAAEQRVLDAVRSVDEQWLRAWKGDGSIEDPLHRIAVAELARREARACPVHER